jgi:multifunctional 2-oxoglutarate metabolism enzyme
METSRFGVNASYVESLRVQWEQDPSSVAEEWRTFFTEELAGEDGPETEVAAVPAAGPLAGDGPPAGDRQGGPTGNGHGQAQAESSHVDMRPAAPPSREVRARVTPSPNDRIEPLRGVAARIVENMSLSLELPTAMSTRAVPVKVLEENRRVINTYLEDDARPRASFTHIIAYALVRAVEHVPSMNHGFTVDDDGQPVRLVREDVNLGLAVDLPARGGGRSLVVPNLKGAQKLDFRAFLEAYNDLIERARAGKLTTADFESTTITLTNPGGLGTVASAPRLMAGQGCIIATGAIGYPAEYEAMAPETLRALGVGKVMTMTSTYDHRIIQGAESGAYLSRVHQLLNGEHGFYDELFRALRIPHHPYRLMRDRAVQGGLLGGGFADTEKAMRVSQLIHAFRVRGHILANVDPLDLKPREHPDLNLDKYGLTIWDLDRQFLTLGVLDKPIAPLRDILERLRDSYCRRMGVEYMHIADVEQRRWVQERVERKPDPLSIEDKTQILDKLCAAQGFERFLHKRYLGQKRFSIEGAESAIAMLIEGLDMVAAFGSTDVFVGMAHRGRLSVLANVLGKPFEAIFAEFEDLDPKTVQGSGDVKYHLGAKGIHTWKGETLDTATCKPTGSIEERALRIELACNPSHLEAVDPFVLCAARARQDMTGDRARKKVVPFLLHGDAAFAGQGVVYEVMQMSALNGYRVGGTVHVVINNQIGYTTGPERARSSMNCSDIARAVQAPVLRVNGDDAEACIRAMRIGVEYRMRFGRDVVIDMVCYRRWGHNEGDEPSFTQPILYRAIERHEPTRDHYASLLVRRGDLSEEEVKNVDRAVHERLEKAFGAIKEKGRDAIPEASGTQKPTTLQSDEHQGEPEGVDTRVPLETLKRITDRITYAPDVIEIHPRVKSQILERRRAMVFVGKEGGGPGIDFGMAENLAFGSLLLEGIPVRLSGQDVGRGTFAQRHAVLYDVNDGRPYIPLNFLHKSRDEGEEQWHPSRFRIYDSLLSEEAVLGFEYGYSVTHPDSLVLWEAQFGDFWNGAQVQVDQFISAGEAKWNQKSRVVMMLPHGYDGQGPEHSSARIERFLQLCAEEPFTGPNMRVCIASTPAQHFHLLRRQAKLPKKPLVMMTHKSLLRAEDAASTVVELAEGRFESVLDDPRRVPGARVRRVVLCSGKLYWDIDRGRQKANAPDVAVLRVEQLYPFPAARLRALLEELGADEVIWAQEEPKNMGAWFFVDPLLRSLGVSARYVGRDPAASPATGSHKRHVAEQQGIVETALRG